MGQQVIRSSRFPGTVLREASVEDGIEVWTMLREIGPGENGFGNEGHNVPYSRFGAYLQRRMDMRAGVELPDGRVPTTTYWLRSGSFPVGICKLRHRLTDSLRRVGGHVSYCIRPSERGNGFGNTLLGLALVASGRMGLEEVLVTCQEHNMPSRKVVEWNGGELERIEVGIAYYWIECPSPFTGAGENESAALRI